MIIIIIIVYTTFAASLNTKPLEPHTKAGALSTHDLRLIIMDVGAKSPSTDEDVTDLTIPS